ncbi:hypothetical protein PR003_g18189 [Phytophthora rubi]|uniref:Uncharacterized protein n=1 Tax=Phytophthora rubi TaxID=129364 RepID=A0A6A4E8N2_9STRA|nr:hypothetical protein PR002_g17625 [Phytophthora rubi]KAE9006021.1 hypothetical protein PR001_g17303 [Phytophthora rubi]KAE9318634.1 hypothetical protein PR003_g18189 [Phytophthora rubi]
MEMGAHITAAAHAPSIRSASQTLSVTLVGATQAEYRENCSAGAVRRRRPPPALGKQSKLARPTSRRKCEPSVDASRQLQHAIGSLLVASLKAFSAVCEEDVNARAGSGLTMLRSALKTVRRVTELGVRR